MHLNVVRHLAAKFAHRGELLEDLIQVGSIGLIHAVERFDPERGTKFTTYATPTVVGEIKRYFRDTAWTLRAPRALQELSVQLIRANEMLSQQLGRSPTIAELTAHVGAPEEEVLDAMELGNSYEMLSLDKTVEIEGAGTVITLQDELGAMDPGLQKVELCDALKAAVERLDNRAKTIIYLRFYHGLSQSEVAKRLQISQMHVSRLQRQALRRLKDLLAEAANDEGGSGG
jgi:RNA polymerase sigma-B factor